MSTSLNQNQPEQQITTEVESRQQIITEVELDACRMWFEGYSSPEIEASLSKRYGDIAPKAQTIRLWFSPKNGRLFEYFKNYAKEETVQRRKETLNLFRAQIKNAGRVLVQVMNDPAQHTPSRVKSAELIINRQLGEPVKPIARLDVKNPAREILEEAGLVPKHDGGEVSEDADDL